MKHYIIVKFKNNYNYKYEINNIKNLFDEAKKIDGIEEITIKSSNSNRENRFDLMIEAEGYGLKPSKKKYITLRKIKVLCK